MKQFLLLVVVCALGYFFAPQVLGIKANSARQYRNAAIYTEEDRKLYSVREGNWDRMMPQATLTIMMNLTEAENVREPTKLVTIKGNAAEFGLMITKDGLVGNWVGNPWGPGKPLPISRLANNPNVVSTNKADCIALSVIVNGVNDSSSKTSGLTVVDSSGDVLLSYPALNTSNNDSYRSYEFNEVYISHVMITPKLLSVKGAGSRAQRLEKASTLKPGNAMVAFGGGGVVILILAAAWSKLVSSLQSKKRADNSALKLQSLS